MAVYPNSIFPWTARRNNLDVVWAADPNQLAAEIQAIETVIGPKPNVETGTWNNVPVSYADMNTRIAVAATDENKPYAMVARGQISVHVAPPADVDIHFSAGKSVNLNFYNVESDNYGMYNGTDLTVPTPGLYMIFANCSYSTTGAFRSGLIVHNLLINGNLVDSGYHAFNYPSEAIWDQLGDYAYTDTTYMAGMNTGDRISVQCVNATNGVMSVEYATLRVFLVRQFSAAQPFFVG